jgi:Cysteine-rich secretory protein family
VICLRILPAILIASVAVAQQRDDVAARQIFADLNGARTKAGLPALRWNEPLAEAAAVHTEKQARAGTLSHDLPGELGLGPRLAQSGARVAAIAENVGSSSEGPDEIHAAWMNSSGHRENILSPAYDIVGIGVYRMNGVLYATEDFGKEVKSISPDDADLRVRDAVAAERKKDHLPPLQLMVVNGAANSSCSAPDPAALAMAPGHTRSTVSFTIEDPSNLPELLKSKLTDPRWRTYALQACEESTQQGFTRFRVRVVMQD